MTSWLAALGRAVASAPLAMLRSTQAKLGLLGAGMLGLTVGANSRASGREPSWAIDRVRDELFTADGRLADSGGSMPPSPMHRALAERLGPWATEPVFEVPEAYTVGVEQWFIVPFARSMLAVLEAAAGVGYWLAGVVPPAVVGYGGGVVFLAGTLLLVGRRLRDVLEVFG